MVSMKKKSTPSSARYPACSRKFSSKSSILAVPTGGKNAPEGPISPAM